MDTASSAPQLAVTPRVLADTTAAMNEIAPSPPKSRLTPRVPTPWLTLRCNSRLLRRWSFRALSPCSPSSPRTPAITTNAMYFLFMPGLVASTAARVSAKAQPRFVFTSAMVVDSYIAFGEAGHLRRLRRVRRTTIQAAGVAQRREY
ncbi:hypothetical protein HPB52_012325 [Rhipicephalus sanguineus]|uniref:Uncharacterized protein n=1 Tax=Rhipicephalus sanguineus TaxID=34632 RepID=A0A9D4T9S2_RHISA|nr:hypothetical protein HPB52_012325 [Rhipicephalus sanguineus]